VSNGRQGGLAVQAAMICRRHYLDGATKSQIAEEFGLSRFKVARILEEAFTNGMVRIAVIGPQGTDLDLSEKLRSAFGLHHAVVVDTPADTDDERRRLLGAAAAELITELVDENDVLGIGWGRTLDAMVLELRSLRSCAVVQMAGIVGPLTETAVELVRRVSSLSGGLAHPLYAPLMVSDVAAAQIIRGQSQVASVIEKFKDITVAVVAIGSWRPPNSQLRNWISPKERAYLTGLGVQAEICSTMVDRDGTVIAPDFAARAVSISAAQLRAIPETVAVAGGADKAEAIRAVLRGGFLTSLVTDADAATRLLTP
jgi:DNA-binding transcriptional regulator LsrR (DeoR family)